jgi:hypothetical protein
LTVMVISRASSAWAGASDEQQAIRTAAIPARDTFGHDAPSPIKAMLVLPTDRYYVSVNAVANNHLFLEFL